MTDTDLEFLPLLYYLEDDYELKEAITDELRCFGFDVRDFLTAKSMLKAWSKRKPDLYLFDLALDDVENGFEIALKMIEQNSIDPVRFYFFSGYDSNFFRPSCFLETHVFRKGESMDVVPALVAAMKKTAAQL